MSSSREILDEIAGDNLSGAAEIYLRTIEYFRALLDENSGASCSVLRDVFVRSARKLLRAQSEMAPLYNLAADILAEFGATAAGPRVSKRVESVLDRSLEAQRGSARDLTDNAVPLVPRESRILTISNSSAVRDAITNHPARSTLTVIIPESRPMCEGVGLVDSLGRHGVKTILIVDFAIYGYIRDSDLFICGADAVTEKSLVNKIGTAMVSKLVKDAGKSTIALFTETKLISETVFRFMPRLRDASEVSADIPPLCSVENRYFEECPLENFTHLVSEKNLYSAESLRRRLSDRVYPKDLL